MSISLQQVIDWLQVYAPLAAAETWDNVGLLLGDPAVSVERVMTCLTVTPTTAREAIAERAGLIVTHHPLPFQPLSRITTDAPAGRLVWELVGAGVAVFSAHTAFDSAAEGINQRLAEGLGLQQIAPLVIQQEASHGAGRWGRLAATSTLAKVGQQLRQFLGIEGLHQVGDATHAVAKVAVACGSGGEFLAAATELGCDCLVTGEARFHTCLEAEALQIGLLLPGHFASERFAQERLAEVLQAAFPALQIWASEQEADPLRWT